MTAPGLFAEPERMGFLGEFAGWSCDRLEAGVISSVAAGGWEAVHRVVAALLEQRVYGHGPLRAMALAVVDLHEPARMYRDCRHHHEVDDEGRVPDGVFWMGGDLEDYICEAGYDATVCQACDVDEDSARAGAGTWPCPTFRALAAKLVEALGVRA